MPLTTPQQKVIDSKARFRVLISGRRFGKTFVAINELARFARFPKQKCWYVAPSYRQAKQIVWTDLKEKIIKHRWHSKINDSDLSIILKNKSEIALRGADNFDALRGVGLNFLVMDEISDIKLTAWTEVLRPTLSNTQGHCLFCTSPKGFNWAYDLYVKGTKDNNWESFKFTTLDGGQVDVEEIEQAKNDLDERTFQQEYLASFVNYAGIIYYNFNRTKNIIDNYEITTDTIHIGLDFNIDPMCATVGQIKDNNVYIFDEIQIWSSNTNEMVEEIQRRYKQKVIVYPDPSARQRKTSAGGFTDISILKNAGLEVRSRSAHPLVRDRINAVNTKLKNANGMSSLFIVNSCRNLIKSVERQVYKENTHVPDKESGYDHFNDALGYFIEYVYPLRRDFKPSKPTRWS
tara:strand:+ start:3915 stop:5126 length:1212 start_codon:yes stop_codon:yes gene_type:complete